MGWFLDEGDTELSRIIKTRPPDIKIASSVGGFFTVFVDVMPFLFGEFRFEASNAVRRMLFERLYANINQERLRKTNSLMFVLASTTSACGILLWGWCLLSHLAGMINY